MLLCLLFLFYQILITFLLLNSPFLLIVDVCGSSFYLFQVDGFMKFCVCLFFFDHSLQYLLHGLLRCFVQMLCWFDVLLCNVVLKFQWKTSYVVNFFAWSHVVFCLTFYLVCFLCMDCFFVCRWLPGSVHSFGFISGRPARRPHFFDVGIPCNCVFDMFFMNLYVFSYYGPVPT